MLDNFYADVHARVKGRNPHESPLLCCVLLKLHSGSAISVVGSLLLEDSVFCKKTTAVKSFVPVFYE